MKALLARWDVSPSEQAELRFGQVLTVINLRRVEIACVLGILTKAIEWATGYRAALHRVEIPGMVLIILASLAVRRSGSLALARGFTIAFIACALVTTQWDIAALGAEGRLTSGYQMLLLSLTLLFVAPPRFLVTPLAIMFASYSAMVLNTPTGGHERMVAIVNTAIVSGIAFVAAALIHASRRRDYEQKREIRLQNRRLVDRNAELDSLMAITAHDLRSPLYGLRNLINLAVRRAPQEPELPLIVLGQAIASLDAMLALATRLLDAHAAEHAPLKPLVVEDVRGHVLAASSRIAPLAQSLGVEVDVDLPDRMLMATFDAGALGQILDNLLSNGVRFSTAKGFLSIKAMHDVGGAAIQVRDFGPGIDRADHDMLFKRFHPNAGVDAGGMTGKGMGLFIVATLAERMGARVDYDSPAGGGAAFIVRLPATAATA